MQADYIRIMKISGEGTLFQKNMAQQFLFVYFCIRLNMNYEYYYFLNTYVSYLYRVFIF